MPFDTLPPADVIAARNRRHVAVWLFAMCGMILVMVALGGATRLTGSGLSIMEWAPLRGMLPPLSDAEWNRLYELYRKIPQYELLNKGFGLAGFKQIFWLEWAHRLWGRLIGLTFVVPLAWLWWRGAVPRALLPRLLVLFALGGLQGAIGWFMVASGFVPQATSVSPYRLVVHLGLALVLYAAILWTALGLLRTVPVAGPRKLVGLTAVAITLTVLAGGFVAAFHTYLELSGQLVCPKGLFGIGSTAQQSLASFAIILVCLVPGLGMDVARKGISMASISWSVLLGGLFAYGCIVSSPAPSMPPVEKRPLMCHPPVSEFEVR